MQVGGSWYRRVLHTGGLVSVDVGGCCILVAWWLGGWTGCFASEGSILAILLMLSSYLTVSRCSETV